MEAIILAGGLGTRLRAVVSDVPKPMAPVAGRPFIEHLMDYWSKQGVRRFILSIGYKAACFEAYFQKNPKPYEIDYVIEETPKGTGGGLFLAGQGLRNLHSPFLVLNGDTYFQVDLSQMKSVASDSQCALTLAIFSTKDQSQRFGSIQTSPEGRVISLRGEPSEVSYKNGGVYLFSPRVFTTCRFQPGDSFSLETDLLPELLAKDKINTLLSEKTFIDIGVPEDYALAPRIMGLQNHFDSNLERGNYEC